MIRDEWSIGGLDFVREPPKGRLVGMMKYIKNDSFSSAHKVLYVASYLE